ncbi:MAG: thioesterase family protein [Novosphingobium sp.]|nr:thioesterase family protein [Novosphingobium sp.]
MHLRDHCLTLDIAAFPFRKELEGRFRDIDARRHINNIAIAELFSEARTHFIYSFFETIERPEGLFFVVGQQAVFYAGEAHYPGRIEVGVGLFETGRSTLRIGQAFFNERRCTAIAEAVLVCTSGGRAVPFPDGFAQCAAGFMLSDGIMPRQLAPMQ